MARHQYRIAGLGFCQAHREKAVNEGFLPGQPAFGVHSKCTRCHDASNAEFEKAGSPIAWTESLFEAGLITRSQHIDRVTRHEAAHAVYAHAHGYTIAKIQIFSTDPNHKGTIARVHWDDTPKPTAAVHAEICMAGWASDRDWMIRHGLKDPAYLASAAMSSAGDIEIFLGKGGTKTGVSSGIKAALKSWKHHQRKAELVAKRLRASGTMSGDEVMRTIGKA